MSRSGLTIVVLLTALGSVDATAQTTQVRRSGDTTVARTNGTVSASAVRTLAVVWEAGKGDDPATSFAIITSVAVSPNGSVAAWDSKTPALRLYDSTGVLKKTIGRTGAGPGEYNRINGIAFRPDGRLLVWDSGNSRMNVYAPNGDFETSWLLPIRGYGASNALTVDDAGRSWLQMNVWGMNGVAHGAWIRLTPAGELIDTVRAPEPPGSDPPLVARNGGATANYDRPFGRTPVVALGSNGEVLWAAGGPYAINTRLRNTPLRIEREFVPVPISDDERSQARASTEFGLRMTQPDWTWNGPDVAKVKPPLTGLSTGLDGRIWAALNVESERFTPTPPATTAPAGRGPARPTSAFRASEHRWDVFSPDGRWLGQVIAPRKVSALVMRGDYVWGASLDDDDVPVLVKMRITPRW